MPCPGTVPADIGVLAVSMPVAKDVVRRISSDVESVTGAPERPLAGGRPGGTRTIGAPGRR